MAGASRYQPDVDAIVTTRHDHGADSNPGPTLAALDALRLAGLTKSAPAGAAEQRSIRGGDTSTHSPPLCVQRLQLRVCLAWGINRDRV